jgi:chaperonin GroES|tara:strand:+ start:1146 stop:1403 length:258 start_codon:yes stop_codon:yes gene_type:complete
MQAINNYVVIDVVKEELKKVGGLLLTDNVNEDSTFKKASVISVGNLVEIIKEGDVVYYNKNAGHGISYNDKSYKVIRAQDIILVE